MCLTVCILVFVHVFCLTICIRMNGCVIFVSPWKAALVEELASAGEELLERELNGDCLKHSSRNELKQRNVVILPTLIHSPHIICLYTAWSVTNHGNDNENCFHTFFNTRRIPGLPIYSHHVTVFVVVGFAHFFWKQQEKRITLSGYITIKKNTQFL